MPRAKRICNQSGCTAVATNGGRCAPHERKSWSNISARNLTRPADWNRRRRFVLKRDNNKCYLCGRSEATEVDHVVSVARGGSHEYSNLKAICARCHRFKSAAERLVA